MEEPVRSLYYLKELGNRNWIKVNHIYGRWEFDLPNGVELVDESKVPRSKNNDTVEQMPSFPNGMGGLMKWIDDNMKYPVIAAENGVQGRVIVQFIVEKDGSITDVKVLKSVDPSLDKEAIRLAKMMPKWIPGESNGSNVSCKYTIPITFKL